MGLAKMENILDGINIRLYTGEKKFIEPEYITIKTIQSHREKKN